MTTAVIPTLTAAFSRLTKRQLGNLAWHLERGTPICDECMKFRPRCASVRMRVNADGAPTDFRHAGRTVKAVLCGQCRKKGCYRGAFRLLARAEKGKAPTCD